MDVRFIHGGIETRPVFAVGWSPGFLKRLLPASEFRRQGRGDAEMLGEKIAEITGQVGARRVLSVEGRPKLETSFQGSGILLGVNETETGTYVSEMRPDGTLFGEGRGIAMGKNGEVATWTSQGVGTIKKDGSVSFRGTSYYQSTSPAWLRLNGVACVFEYEADVGGHSKKVLSEWR
jgi:hypothetical protein